MLFTAIGGLMGQEHTQAAGDAQKEAIGQMIAKLDSVGMPPDQSAAIILDQYKQAGLLTPQLEQQVKDSVSSFQGIKTDQASRNMQTQALQRMAQYGKAGLTPDERAVLNQSRQSVQRDNEAKQQQIIQNMAARGQGGGGAELAARLAASQGSADQASQQADSVSSMAAQRALQAIGAQSNMAGQLRTQDFGEEATKANAQDQMNRFNVQNQMAINQRNTTVGNQAQAANLMNAQDLSNKNVGQNNQEKYNQLNRQRQNWLDKMSYAQAYMNPLGAYGQAHAGQEDAKAKMDAAMGKGVDDSIWNVIGMMYGKAPSKSNADTTPKSSNSDMASSGNDTGGGGFGSMMG